MAERAQEVIPLRVKGLPPARERLAAFLRAEHPRDTVVHVQRRLAEFGSEPDRELVKAWVAGRGFPRDDVRLDPLIAAYGKPLVVALWGELILTHEEHAEMELEQQRQRLARREAELQAAREHRRTLLGLR